MENIIFSQSSEIVRTFDELFKTICYIRERNVLDRDNKSFVMMENSIFKILEGKDETFLNLVNEYGYEFYKKNHNKYFKYNRNNNKAESYKVKHEYEIVETTGNIIILMQRYIKYYLNYKKIYNEPIYNENGDFPVSNHKLSFEFMNNYLKMLCEMINNSMYIENKFSDIDEGTVNYTHIDYDEIINRFIDSFQVDSNAYKNFKCYVSAVADQELDHFYKTDALIEECRFDRSNKFLDALGVYVIKDIINDQKLENVMPKDTITDECSKKHADKVRCFINKRENREKETTK